jgi:hypothetical protein
MSLKLDTNEQAKTWLKQKNFEVIPVQENKPQLKEKKIFDKELLLKLNKDHNYWINRGVNQETIELFNGRHRVQRKRILNDAQHIGSSGIILPSPVISISCTFVINP